MKNRIITFFLFIIMLILLGGFLFVGWAIYNDLFAENVVETLHTDENLIAVDDGTHIAKSKQMLYQIYLHLKKM